MLGKWEGDVFTLSLPPDAFKWPICHAFYGATRRHLERRDTCYPFSAAVFLYRGSLLKCAAVKSFRSSVYHHHYQVCMRRFGFLRPQGLCPRAVFTQRRVHRELPAMTDNFGPLTIRKFEVRALAIQMRQKLHTPQRVITDNVSNDVAFD